MRMIMIRHCEATSNHDNGFYGKGDCPLSTEGKKQAKELARFLKDEHIDMIFSSPQKRAYFTALKIAKEKGMDVNKTKLLREVDFGVFEGMTIDEAKEKMPEIFFERQKHKFSFVIPNGESYRDTYNRLISFVGMIVNKKYESVAIVTHATIIKLLLMGLMEMSLDEAERHFFPNGSVTKLQINGKAKINLFNYTGYLDGARC